MQTWIWAHTASPPQHIGATDGLDSLADLLQGARGRGHGLRHAVSLARGNDVSVHMFDSQARRDEYLARNPDLIVTGRADFADVLAVDLDRLQRAREAARDARPMAAGGLFDDVTRSQLDLF